MSSKQVNSKQMSPKQVSIYLIAISIVAAAAIILSSYLWPASSQTITYFIIAIWFVPFTWLTGRTVRQNSKDKEKK